MNRHAAHTDSETPEEKRARTDAEDLAYNAFCERVGLDPTGYWWESFFDTPFDVELEIENIYEDGEQITTHPIASITHPPPGVAGDEDYEEWAYDAFFEHTGTGKTEGDSAYFVKVVRCDARPDLVGREFEFGDI